MRVGDTYADVDDWPSLRAVARRLAAAPGAGERLCPETWALVRACPFALEPAAWRAARAAARAARRFFSRSRGDAGRASLVLPALCAGALALGALARAARARLGR